MTQRLLLVDNRVTDAHVLCASSAPGVHPLLLDYSSDTFDTLRQKVSDLNVASFAEIGFASHGYFAESYSFLAQQHVPSTLKNVNTVDEHLYSWCELQTFMEHLVKEYNARSFYFIMCELCTDPDWVYVLNRLEERTGAMIHATDGKIGSAAKGGGYVMTGSSVGGVTGVDLRQTFFEERI